MRFAEEIMREEWSDFEKRHRDAIKRRTTRHTGTLEDRRSYRTAKATNEITSSFTHPVYERFLDMRKNYFGDVKSKHGTKRDALTRKRGIPIHNRIIYGKLNPLSFRLLNELSWKVRDYMKARFAGSRP